MGIFIKGIFVASSERLRDGKPDGWDVLLAVGTRAMRIKFSDEVFNASDVASAALGDVLTVQVNANAYKDNVYFSAVSVAF